MAKKLITVGEYASLGDVLGKGSFGTVYFGIQKITKVPVAIKELDLEKLFKEDRSKKLRNHLKNEIEIMSKIKHPNVVSLYDCKQQNKLLYIVLEFCNGGTFESFINSQPNKRLNEAEAQYYMKQFASGLSALRKVNAIHRDLKPENLLLSKNSDGTMTLKIADFGFAREVQEGNVLIQTICGTPLYSAPEVISNEKYTVKSDLWSVGIILYQLLYGKTPFHATNWQDFFKKVKYDPIRIPANPPISDECRDLLTRLLQRDANIRISWDHFFSHPFIDLQLNSESDINDALQSSSSISDDQNFRNEKEEKERDEAVLAEAEQRIQEQFLQSVAIAKLASDSSNSNNLELSLSLYCKSLQILQTTLSFTLSCRKWLNKDEPLYSVLTSKISEMRNIFERYLNRAEELNVISKPSTSVIEQYIYQTAIEYSQKGLNFEAEQIALSMEYYENSLLLFHQLRLDAIIESDKHKLDNFIANIKQRIEKCIEQI